MSSELSWNLSQTALLTIDLQNDFLHPDGAYGRAKQGCDAIAALPDRLAPLIDALRQRGGTYISAQFTLVPRPDGEPLIAPHLKALRPFLGRGDFHPGNFGHALVDTLAPADYTVEKVNYSAFFGIVTNGGVASTLRDAHLRNIDTLMLSDGCAAFDSQVHEATLLSLRTVTHQMRNTTTPLFNACSSSGRTYGGVGARRIRCADSIYRRVSGF